MKLNQDPIPFKFDAIYLDYPPLHGRTELECILKGTLLTVKAKNGEYFNQINVNKIIKQNLGFTMDHGFASRGPGVEVCGIDLVFKATSTMSREQVRDTFISIVENTLMERI